MTCEGCEFVRDEPWAGKREICHRCMAPGECQGYAVGFDQIWTSPPPKWCGKRRSIEARSFGAASGLAQDDRKTGGDPQDDRKMGGDPQDDWGGGDTSSGADAPPQGELPQSGKRGWLGPSPQGEGLGLRPSALKDPPRFESRGELHPGAMDAPMLRTKAAAADRWAALAEQMRGHLIRQPDG